MKRDKEKYANEDKFFVEVGEKSFNYLSKRGFNIVNKFIEVGDYVEPEQVHPIADFLAKGYLEKSGTG